MEKLTRKEKCLHYIGWHTFAYGAPAVTDNIQEIMSKEFTMSAEETDTLLDQLKKDGEISFSEESYTEGWIISKESERGPKEA